METLIEKLKVIAQSAMDNGRTGEAAVIRDAIEIMKLMIEYEMTDDCGRLI